MLWITLSPGDIVMCGDTLLHVGSIVKFPNGTVGGIKVGFNGPAEVGREPSRWPPALQRRMEKGRQEIGDVVRYYTPGEGHHE